MKTSVKREPIVIRRPVRALHSQQRHIHFNPAEAAAYGVKNMEFVKVRVGTPPPSFDRSAPIVSLRRPSAFRATCRTS